jgi:hypothetical protein
VNAEVLTPNARDRLVDELCRLYPTYEDLEMFLSLRLDRSLAHLAARGPLLQVAFAVVRTAEDRGWIRGLVTAAAIHSPHSEFLRALAAAKPPGTTANVRDEADARVLDLVLLAAGRWKPLAAAIGTDPRVRECRYLGSADVLRGAPGRADALVVSNEVAWAGRQPPEFGTVPVVLLATGPDPSSWEARTLAYALAAQVTQIVVAGPLEETARRIVDHLVTVVGPTP